MSERTSTTSSGKRVGDSFRRSNSTSRMSRGDKARIYRDESHRLHAYGRPDACTCDACIRRDLYATGIMA